MVYNYFTGCNPSGPLEVRILTASRLIAITFHGSEYLLSPVSVWLVLSQRSRMLCALSSWPPTVNSNPSPQVWERGVGEFRSLLLSADNFNIWPHIVLHLWKPVRSAVPPNRFPLFFFVLAQRGEQSEGRGRRAKGSGAARTWLMSFPYRQSAYSGCRVCVRGWGEMKRIANKMHFSFNSAVVGSEMMIPHGQRFLLGYNTWACFIILWKG